MAIKQSELATERARLYPSTYKRFRVRAAKRKLTIAQVIDEAERKTRV